MRGGGGRDRTHTTKWGMRSTPLDQMPSEPNASY